MKYTSKPKCEFCADTGYYGNNGAGCAGNAKIKECDSCTISERCYRTNYKECWRCNAFTCEDNPTSQPSPAAKPGKGTI